VIGSTRSVRVFAYGQPTDMRRGFDGLYGLVREHLKQDPLSGDMYLFVSGNRKRAKVLMSGMPPAAGMGGGVRRACERMPANIAGTNLSHSCCKTAQRS